MSSYSEERYMLRQQAREKAFRDRVRNTTDAFYRRYQAQYDGMLRKGYSDYIPDEMTRLGNDLERIRDLLDSDPKAARDVSFNIGRYISSLGPLAEAAKMEFERKEEERIERARIERQRQRTEVSDAYYAAVSSIKSPIIAGFAQDELAEIQKKLSGMAVEDVKRAVDSAIKSGERKAEEWKKATMERQAAEAAKEQLQTVREQIESESIEDRAAGAELRAQLEQLERDMAEGKRSAEETLKNANDVAMKSDDLLVSEEERRQVVMAITKELRTQGFSVARPTLEHGGFVKILAQRQSGERAECHIDAHGKMQYRFDRYPAMACMKDIKRFHADLSKAYGISFSDERVLWENPDRLSADGFSYSAPDQQGGNA